MALLRMNLLYISLPEILVFPDACYFFENIVNMKKIWKVLVIRSLRFLDKMVMLRKIYSCTERTGKELIEIVFTLHPSLANPDKQGVWRGEEVLQLFTTLHLFSPSRRDSLICSSNSSRNRRLGNWICRIPPLWVVAETWVKSGEEWWRVEPTLHLVIRPVYRGLRGMGEEWRVFHDSIVYSNLEIKNPWCWSLFSISYCRFYYAVWTAN